MTARRRPAALFCCLCLTWLCLPVFADADAAEGKASAVTIEPIGLSITRAIEGVDEDEDISRFHSQIGTEVKVLIKAEGKGLIDFDDNASKIKAFTDDKGNSLIKNERGFGFSRGFSWFRTSSDGKMATLDINANLAPPKGATQLKITGTLVLTVASEKQLHEKKGVAIKDKTEFKAGPLTATLDEVGEPDPDWSDNKLKFNLIFKQDVSNLAEIVFLDKAGKPIEAERNSTMRVGGFGRSTTTFSYELKRKVDQATIVFAVWKDAEKIEVPVDLSVDVGL